MRMITSLALTAAGLVVAAPVRADLVEDFRREYPAAAARVEAAYSQARMQTRETRRDPDGQVTLVTENEYIRVGDRVWGSMAIGESAVPHMPPGTVHVFGGSPETYVDLRNNRADAGLQFVSDLLVPLRSTCTTNLVGALRSTDNFDLLTRDNCRPIFAPHCFFEMRIVDYLKMPGVSVLSATTSDLDGQQVISVLTELTPEEEGTEPDTIRYRFYFEPESWLLLGFTQYLDPEDEDAEVGQHRLTYDTTATPPRLRSLEIWGESPLTPDAGRSKEGGVLYEVTSIEFHEAPAAVDAAAADGGPRETTARTSRQAVP